MPSTLLIPGGGTYGEGRPSGQGAWLRAGPPGRSLTCRPVASSPGD